MSRYSIDEKEKALLARCVAIATSTWSDALDRLGIDGVIEGISRRAGGGRIAGFAVTARQAVGELNQYDRSHFKVGKLVEAAQPGRVVMVTSGGASVSSFGGIASLAASKQGATGIVIDGACRDVDEIRAAKLWMASRHVTPRTGKNRLCLMEMDQPIVVGGIEVADRDLIIGDDSGIVVVPRARLEEVLTQAEEALATDEMVEQNVRSGMSFSDAAAKANYLPLPSED